MKTTPLTDRSQARVRTHKTFMQVCLLGNTWVVEACQCPQCRRVAATSSRQCSWPCPSRSFSLAPAWPRTCYILTLFIFALICSLLFANFKSSGSLFHGSTARTAKEYFRGCKSFLSIFCVNAYWESLFSR
jgi:hypothetical protein